MRRLRLSPTLPLYVGGFLGPFGSGILAVLVPELRAAFDATTAQVALAIPAHMVPYAAVQLVSGTIGERVGRRRVVRTAYVAYALTSIAAAAAPTIGAFLALRVAQGIANAFVTPILLAGLADVTDTRRLGRTVGTFAAVQTAAVAVAPLSGGLLGGVDWRLAFVAPGLVALGLAFFAPSDAARPEGTEPPRLRAVMTRRVALLCGAAFAGFASVAGLAFIVALRLEDAFGLSSIGRGIVLAAFGIGGVLSGRAAGAAVDRFGRIPVAVAGSVVCALLLSTIGLAGSSAIVGVLWFATGVGSSLVWAGLNTLVVEAVPHNRAGATSVFGAFKFAGQAAAPLMFLPVYTGDARLAFVAAGVLASLVAVFALLLDGGGIRPGRRRGASTAARPSCPPPSRVPGR